MTFPQRTDLINHENLRLYLMVMVVLVLLLRLVVAACGCCQFVQMGGPYTVHSVDLKHQNFCKRVLATLSNTFNYLVTPSHST